MNRWLMAAVMALTVVGCAEGVEDPQPAPEPDPVQKPVPDRTLSGDLDSDRAENDLWAGNRLGVPALPNESFPAPPVPGQFGE